MNERLPEPDLARLKVREFPFVANAADQKKACAELDVVASGARQTGKDGNGIIGTPGYQSPPLGKARFVIKSVELTDLGKGKHARFDSVTFEADFELPRAGSSRSKGR